MNPYHQNELSQLQTRIAILESQLELKIVLVNEQKSEIERLVNLVGAIYKKEQWDGSTIEPTLKFMCRT